MFASSPGVSALEHPVYDVWVVDCEEPIVPPEDDPRASGADAAASEQNTAGVSMASAQQRR